MPEREFSVEPELERRFPAWNRRHGQTARGNTLYPRSAESSTGPRMLLLILNPSPRSFRATRRSLMRVAAGLLTLVMVTVRPRGLTRRKVVSVLALTTHPWAIAPEHRTSSSRRKARDSRDADEVVLPERSRLPCAET